MNIIINIIVVTIIILFIIGNLPIRLVSNSSYIGAQYVGRLEILHNGQWGTVCNKSWTFEDSLVVCKELGYASTEQFYTAGFTNPGTGKTITLYTSI